MGESGEVGVVRLLLLLEAPDLLLVPFGILNCFVKGSLKVLNGLEYTEEVDGVAFSFVFK